MWQITFEGRVHREDDLTIDMAERIEELVGESWLHLVPLRSAKHAKAILAVMHSAVTGEPEAAVRAKVGALTVNEYARMIDAAPDDLPILYTDGNPQMADDL
jgi:hypothetical protein